MYTLVVQHNHTAALFTNKEAAFDFIDELPSGTDWTIREVVEKPRHKWVARLSEAILPIMLMGDVITYGNR